MTFSKTRARCRKANLTNDQSIGRRRRLLFEPLESRELLAVVPGLSLTAGAQLITYNLAMATTSEATVALGGQNAARTFADNLTSAVSNLIGSPILA